MPDLQIKVTVDDSAIAALEARLKGLSGAGSGTGVGGGGATSQATKFADKLTAVGGAMSTLGGLTLAATAPAIAGFGASAKAAIDYESALADVQKISSFKSGMGSQFSTDLLKLSGALGSVNPTDLAKISAGMVRPGQSAGDLLLASEAVAKMGVAFDMTAADSGKALGKLSTAFKVPAKDMKTFVGGMNELSNKTGIAGKDLVSLCRIRVNLREECQPGTWRQWVRL